MVMLSTLLSFLDGTDGYSRWRQQQNGSSQEQGIGQKLP